MCNHEGLPLARTLSGSLRLEEDDRGLRVDADLNPNDPDVQRLAPKVARGDIDQMSFGSRVIKQDWEYAEDQPDSAARDTRWITEISLHKGDVSVVNYGANPSTSFQINGASCLTPARQLQDVEETVTDEAPQRRPKLFDYYLAQLHLGRR